MQEEEEEGCGTTSTAQYYSRYILIYWDLYHAQLNALVPKLFPLLFVWWWLMARPKG